MNKTVILIRIGAAVLGVVMLLGVRAYMTSVTRDAVGLGDTREISIQAGRESSLSLLEDRSALPQGFPQDFPVFDATVSAQEIETPATGGLRLQFTLSTYTGVAVVADWYAAMLVDQGWNLTIGEVSPISGLVAASRGSQMAWVEIKQREVAGSDPITDATVRLRTYPEDSPANPANQ